MAPARDGERGTGPDAAAPELVAGRYRVRSRLGGGGMGTVWLAHDEVLERSVALKQVRRVPGASEAERAERRDRALHEGRTAARLTNRHAVAVFDVVLHDDEPWLVMEHVASRDLAEVVEADQVLAVTQAAQIGAQVADALAEAHAAGIVHRDVKPDNILVGEGGQHDAVVKLADFGIALAPGDDAGLPPGFVAGTPAYLAPEVARGGPSTPASDVFALGATLFACLEGETPFGSGGDALDQLARAADGRTVAPRRAGAAAPVLARMLATDPADRPSAAQARDALSEVAAGRRGALAEVLAAPTRLSPVGRAAAGLGAAAVIGAGVGAAAGAGGPAAVGAVGAAAGKGGLGALLSKPVVLAVATLSLGLAGGAAVVLTRSDPPPPPPAVVAPATPAAVTASAAESAVRALVGTLPRDPDAALAAAGPALRAVGATGARLYLDQVLSFDLGAVDAQDGGTVSAEVRSTLFDGVTTSTPVRFTVTAAASGLVVDSPDLAALLIAGPPPG